MANVSKLTGCIYASAPTAFEAFSAMTDALVEAGGDWEVKGPFLTGMHGGAVVTGSMYEAKVVKPRVVCPACHDVTGCSACAYGEA